MYIEQNNKTYCLQFFLFFLFSRYSFFFLTSHINKSCTGACQTPASVALEQSRPHGVLMSYGGSNGVTESDSPHKRIYLFGYNTMVLPSLLFSLSLRIRSFFSLGVAFFMSLLCNTNASYHLTMFPYTLTLGRAELLKRRFARRAIVLEHIATILYKTTRWR